ncbi:MAG TPA: S8 family serine peptidase [Acidimicrobiales bacterium]|nr:S8 family serine peptidase [Acidimicrobiales bacterium]
MNERVHGSARRAARIGVPVLAVVLAAVGFGPAAFAAPSGAGAAVPGAGAAVPGDGIVVRLRPNQSSQAVASDAGVSVVSGAPADTFLLRGQTSKVAAALAKLSRDPRVEYAEPNATYRALEVPDDTCINTPCGSPGPGRSSPNTQWAPARIDAYRAWDVSHGSSNVLVAVLDSGVDDTHPDLAGKVVIGPKFTDPNTGAVCDHGTHVAGIITAIPNNTKGVAGIGWDTRVLSIKVLGDDTTQDCPGSLFAIAQGINAAVQMGAKVINMSLGGSFDSRTLREAVRNAQANGVLVVAAAGNEGQAQSGNPVEYPAAYTGVISVAATGADDRITFYSEHGPWVTMAAPGDFIVSTVPGNDYAVMRGTSMATPHVAAAAGLLFGAIPGINAAEVASRLELTSDDIPGAGTDIRYGRLNMYRALTTAGPGYWMTASDGGVFSFGNSQFYGSTGSIRLNQPIVAMAASPRRKGYWFVAKDGGIFNYGDARFFGALGNQKLPAPIAGMAAMPDGQGYFMVGATGIIYAFGSASGFGDASGLRLNAPIVGMTVTPSGNGYWLVAADGGVFTFGDATEFGSMGGQPLNKPIVGMTTTPSGQGYWLVASDGGMFSFGDARFFGSMGGQFLSQPIVGMKSTPSGLGYWLVASDGGMFSFGDARFFGSMGGIPLNKPVVGMG